MKAYGQAPPAIQGEIDPRRETLLKTEATPPTPPPTPPPVPHALSGLSITTEKLLAKHIKARKARRVSAYEKWAKDMSRQVAAGSKTTYPENG